MPQFNPFFSHLNNFFDKIFLITLRKSKDRHRQVNDYLKGLNYEIRWGVDGSKLNFEEIQAKGLYDSGLAKKRIPIGKDLTLGEIGCALSHIELYKEIVAKGYPNVLILEDDVAVTSHKSDELLKALNELPTGWDLLYLGYMGNNSGYINLKTKIRINFAYPILNKLGGKNYSAQRIRCKFPRPYSKHLDFAGFHEGTHAYAVTATGAKKILRFQDPISMASDNAIGVMCMEERLRAFRMKERVFYQNRELATTIEGRYKAKV